MNTRGLLDQLLKTGQSLLQNQQGKSLSDKGSGNIGSLLSGAGGGALAAGAMGLLLGNKKARRYGGKALTYGCLLYTSPSPRDLSTSRMPSSA